MKNSVFLAAVLTVFCIPLFPASASDLQTEFPEPGQIEPPVGIPAPALKEWAKRQHEAKKQTAAQTRQVVEDINVVPLETKSFKLMGARLAAFSEYRKTMPVGEGQTWIQMADVSNNVLGKCTLLDSVPSGVEVDGKLTGNVRAFQCPEVGAVLLKEDLLQKGGMVDLSTTATVNARMVVGGVKRGVVLVRMIHPEDKETLTVVRWRSGDKSVTLDVQGTGPHSLQFVQDVASELTD